MRRFLAPFALLLVATAAEAQTVPHTLGFSGRLLTSADQAPVEGEVTLVFDIFTRADAAMAGDEQVWEETHPGVDVAEGLTFATLGDDTDLLADGVLDGERWLQITVIDADGPDVLLPRLPLRSVPYALRAETATIAATAVSLEGFDPSVVQRRSATNMSCETGSYLQSIAADGTATCVADTNTTYTAGTGLSVSAGTFSVNATACGGNQVSKFIGGTFTCVNDLDTNTTYTAGNGLAVTGTQFAVKAATCAAGQYATYDGGQFTCATDANTTYSAPGNGGITVGAGNALMLSSTTCAAGEAWIWNGTSWGCTPIGEPVPNVVSNNSLTLLSGGHLYTGGATPTIVRGTAVPNATVSINGPGTDVAGEILVNTQSFTTTCNTVTPCELARVTFAQPYASPGGAGTTPAVMISARNGTAGGLVAWASPTPNGFSLMTSSQPAQAANHQYYYLVIGR